MEKIDTMTEKELSEIMNSFADEFKILCESYGVQAIAFGASKEYLASGDIACAGFNLSQIDRASIRQISAMFEHFEEVKKDVIRIGAKCVVELFKKGQTAENEDEKQK